MMFFLLIWALSSLGFFALACSMSKHQKQFYSKELCTRQISQNPYPIRILLS